MGATGWTYAVPYEPDVEEALQKLRRKVFAERAYTVKPVPSKEAVHLLAACLANPSDEQLANQFREFVKTHGTTEPRQSLPHPDTIEALIDRCGEDGTHSILDITRSSARPGFGVAAPVPAKVLLECFGTTEPSREQYETNPESFTSYIEGVDRWESIYILLYRNGRPSEIVFEGCSGD